ncbi:MAG: hypothetical protein Q4G16_07510 [Cruoricaptor ignavus]|nr:hypothetical protein [Cruoricaptor ignavus]
MKRFFSLLLLAVFGFVITSCSDRDNNTVDNDTYSVVYQATGTFAPNSYELYYDFPRTLPNTDMVLVYRLSEVYNGQAVWQQIPRTVYLTEGELDYDFDFTVSNVRLFVQANYDIANTPSDYLVNQTFRMLVIPASAGKNAVDLSDYDAVVKHYNINDKQVIDLK